MMRLTLKRDITMLKAVGFKIVDSMKIWSEQGSMGIDIGLCEYIYLQP